MWGVVSHSILKILSLLLFFFGIILDYVKAHAHTCHHFVPVSHQIGQANVICKTHYICLAFSGAFLEDAMFVSCGHSFGGIMLRRVIEMVSTFTPTFGNFKVLRSFLGLLYISVLFFVYVLG